MSTAPRRLALAAGEVHVWTLADSAAGDAHAYFAVLDMAERARAARFRFEADRQTYVAAHWLLRTALSHYDARPPAAWRFCSEEGGRPRLAPETPADLHFSLSHAGRGALAAVGRMPAIGIDLEGADSLARMREIAPRFLHPAELERWRDMPEPAASRFALTLWTLKEACAKATGRGLALDFRGIRFIASGGGWRLAGDPAHAMENWYCAAFAPWPGARAALAVAAQPSRAITWRVLHARR